MPILHLERHEKGFTCIVNETLNDERLSYRARGVLASLLSKPEGWVLNKTALANAGRETPHAIDVALKELYELGYLTQEATRDGRLFTGSRVTVHERPIEQVPSTGQDLADSTEQPPLVSTKEDLVSTDIRDNLEKRRGKGKDYRFEDAWNLYPRREGKKLGKEPARQQWVKLSYAIKCVAWSALGRFAASQPGYPPDMVRWLRNKGWEDWLEKSPPALARVSGDYDPALGPRVPDFVPYNPEGRPIDYGY